MAAVKFSRLSLRRLREIQASIDADTPAAAVRVIERLQASCALLADQPLLGRMVPGTNLRSLVSAQFGYRIVYRVEGSEVIIRDILHARQRQR